jgi:L-malate glycosyltransferase
MSQDFLDAGSTLRTLRLRRSHDSRPRQTPGRLGMWGVGLTRLLGILRESPCDVIDAHLFGSNALGILAGLFTRTPVAITYYDRLDHLPALRRPAVRWTLRRAAAVITDSHVRCNEYRATAPPGSGRFVVIPNGLATPRPKLSPMEIKRRLGVPTTTGPIIAQISRLEPFKGHMVLLDAAQMALRHRPDLFFLLVGFPGLDQGYVESLHQRARDLGIADRVRIVGYQGDIGDVWSIVDVHAHASLYDSLPNAIIEGMSLARPLVATTVGGIPEMVEHETTGLLVAPNESSAFADALLRIIGDQLLAQSLGSAAQQRYLERCEPQAFARKLESLFAKLARRSFRAAEALTPERLFATEVCHENP